MSFFFIYHANCPDGIAAAWAARKYDSSCELYAAKHGSEPPDVLGKHVIMGDFCYPLAQTLMLKDKAESLVILDHHVSSFEQCGHLPYYIYAADKSGAQMTWDWFFNQDSNQQPIKSKLIDYIGDVDLWQFSLPHVHEVSSFLEQFPMHHDSLGDWDAAAAALEEPDRFYKIVERQRPVVRFKSARMNQILKSAYNTELGGHLVPCVNSSIWKSELGNELSRGLHTFAIVWSMSGSGRFHWSLRSDRAIGMNVEQIAKRFGGGGHKNAASFSSESYPDMVIEEDFE